MDTEPHPVFFPFAYAYILYRNTLNKGRCAKHLATPTFLDLLYYVPRSTHDQCFELTSAPQPKTDNFGSWLTNIEKIMKISQNG